MKLKKKKLIYQFTENKNSPASLASVYDMIFNKIMEIEKQKYGKEIRTV